MSTECENCKFREGDCGYHHTSEGVTNYNIASLNACDKYGNCMFFERMVESKGDLISREALRKAFHERIYYFDKSSWDEANALIDTAPTIEVDKLILIVAKRHGKREMMLNALRPHGKWIKQEWGYICSVCNESNDYAYDNNIHKFTDNFCPNCGARMEADNE